MIVPAHKVPGLSILDIARKPVRILNREDHDIIRLKPQYRRHCVAVMKDGTMFAAESGHRIGAAEILDSYIPDRRLIAYLIHVRPK